MSDISVKKHRCHLSHWDQMNACVLHLSCVARRSPSSFSVALANSVRISYSFSFSSRTVAAHTLRRVLQETPTSSRRTPRLDIVSTTTYLRTSIYAGWLSIDVAILPRLASRGLLGDSPTSPSAIISQKPNYSPLYTQSLSTSYKSLVSRSGISYRPNI